MADGTKRPPSIIILRLNTHVTCNTHTHTHSHTHTHTHTHTQRHKHTRTHTHTHTFYTRVIRNKRITLLWPYLSSGRLIVLSSVDKGEPRTERWRARHF